MYIISCISEYRLQQHNGALFGYYAKAMVLPDMKAGVFIAVNGPDGYRSGPAMNKISLYAMDILLEEEPWVNSTHPFNIETNPRSASDFNMEENFKKESSLLASIKPVKKFQKALADYAGVYGNFAMGNITVIYDNDTDDLVAYYGEIGVFILILINDEDPTNHVFAVNSQDPFWFLPPVRANFLLDADNGEVTGLSVPIMLPPFPPVFIRGLDIADAPDPPTDGC